MNEYEVNEEGVLAAPEEEVSGEIIAKVGALFSPEGIILMSVALSVDVGELLVEFIPGVGQIISIAIDIFAILFFGFWMWFFHSKRAKITPKAAVSRAKVLQWGKRMKWLRPLCFIIELIPIGSSFLPLWILIVYLELVYE